MTTPTYTQGMYARRRQVVIAHPRTVAAVAMAAVAGYLFAFAWSMEHTSYDIWGGFVVAPVLVVLTVPLGRHVARLEGDTRIGAIVLAAVVAKLLGSVVLYMVAYKVYQGGVDAAWYHDEGARAAEFLRRGDLGYRIPFDLPVVGSGFVILVTGAVYALIGPTKLGGFLVFSWAGFWGLYLFYRAFCISVPEGDRRRYAALVFFLPSLLFWPSTIGKDALMVLTLGLLAFGSARLLTHSRGGLVATAAGIAGSAMVRPHVTLMAFVGLSFGFLLRRSRRLSLAEPAKVVGLAVLVVTGVLMIGRVEQFLGVDQLDSESVENVLTTWNGITRSYEGSRFDTGGVPSPLGLPMGVVTVLFRPFPHEATSVQGLAASLEGVLLLVLFGLSVGRLLSLPRQALRTPYVAFAVAFSLLFAYAFSSFGNFGLLARQRAQLLPLALVVLALPRPPVPGKRLRSSRRRPLPSGAAVAEEQPSTTAATGRLDAATTGERMTKSLRQAERRFVSTGRRGGDCR